MFHVGEGRICRLAIGYQERRPSAASFGLRAPLPSSIRD